MTELNKFDYTIKNINSSIIEELQYSKEKLTLRVEFKNKVWYQYYGVCNSTFEDLVKFSLNTTSFSEPFNTLIKNANYKYDKER